MNLAEKMEVAQALVELGVDVIEAGFPIASPGDFEAVRADRPRRPRLGHLRPGPLPRRGHRPRLGGGPARRAPADPRLPGHQRHPPRVQAQDGPRTRSSARPWRASRRPWATAPTSSSRPRTPSRTELDFLCQVVEAAIDAGATTVNIPDTVGYATPGHMGHVIRTLRKRVPNIDQAVISVHCHNDLGLAVANSLAAVEAGAGQVECTINGLGERAGNCSLEEIVMALRTRHDYYHAAHQDRHPAARAHQPPGGQHHRHPGAAQQGHRRPERLRPRGRHPPGRHAQGAHAPTRSCGPRTSASPRATWCWASTAAGPPWPTAPRRWATTSPASSSTPSSSSSRSWPTRRRKSTTPTSPRSSSSRSTPCPNSGRSSRYDVHSGSGRTPEVTLAVRRGEELLTAKTASGDGPIDAVFLAIEQLTGMSRDLQRLPRPQRDRRQGRPGRGDGRRSSTRARSIAAAASRPTASRPAPRRSSTPSTASPPSKRSNNPPPKPTLRDATSPLPPGEDKGAKRCLSLRAEFRTPPRFHTVPSPSGRGLG